MDVSIIETSGLGDRSYLVSDGESPSSSTRNATSTACSTWPTIAACGSPTCWKPTSTTTTSPAAWNFPARPEPTTWCRPATRWPIQRRAVSDGDVIDAGPIQLQVMHTPGHTHHHVSYVLRDTIGTVVGVFTGGSMLHGTTGRTDLLGAEHTQALTHAQFHSVRRLAAELPDDTQVYPTHGFGSFCSATPASGDSSTIADQRHTNPALTHDEQTYVDELIAGLSAYPSYYAHMGVINKRGPAPVDLSIPQPVDPHELRRRIEAGEWVVDLRNRTAFAAGHLGGTLGFELSDVVRHLPRLALLLGCPADPYR